MEMASFKEEVKKEMERIYALGVQHGRELERAQTAPSPSQTSCDCPNVMYCDGSCFPR